MATITTCEPAGCTEWDGNPEGREAGTSPEATCAPTGCTTWDGNPDGREEGVSQDATCEPTGCTIWDGDPPDGLSTLCCLPIVDTFDDLRGLPTVLGYIPSAVYARSHSVPNDGGGGLFNYIINQAPGTFSDDDGTMALPPGSDGSLAAVRPITGATYVKWWGTYDDSVDGSPALQAAVDSLGEDGGTIVIPHRLRMDSEVVISTGGVVLTQEGGQGKSFNPGYEGGYISPGANFPGAMIRFAADPNGSATRGCGMFNCSFNGLQRSFTVGSGVHVEACDVFKGEFMTFHRLAGTGLRLSRSVKSEFSALEIGECGDDGKPAWDIDGSNAVAGITQGCTFVGPKLEHNYGDQPHLFIRDGNVANKFLGLGFEQANANNIQAFLRDDADRNQFTALHANQDEDAVEAKFIFNGNKTKITNLTLAGNTPSGGIEINGTDIVLNGFGIQGTTGNANPAIYVPGANAVISGGTISFCGGILVEGKNAHITDIGMRQLGGTVGFDATGARCKLTGATIADVDLATAVRVAGDYSSVNECDIETPTGVGIELAGPACTIQGGSVTGAGGNGVVVSGSNCAVKDLVVQTVGGKGIAVTGSGAMIDNNRIGGSYGHGIHCAEITPSRCSNNTLANVGTGAANTYAGIAITSSTSNIVGSTLVGNSANGGNHLHGIYADSTVQNLAIVGNQTRLGGGIDAAGAGNVIEGNV